MKPAHLHGHTPHGCQARLKGQTHRVCMESAAAQHRRGDAGQRGLGQLEGPDLGLQDVWQSRHSCEAWEGAGRHEADSYRKASLSLYQAWHLLGTCSLQGEQQCKTRAWSWVA